jgi:hypothetical protein
MEKALPKLLKKYKKHETFDLKRVCAQLCIDTLQDSWKLLIFGNGGNTSEA